MYGMYFSWGSTPPGRTYMANRCCIRGRVAGLKCSCMFLRVVSSVLALQTHSAWTTAAERAWWGVSAHDKTVSTSVSTQLRAVLNQSQAAASPQHTHSCCRLHRHTVGGSVTVP